MTYSIVATDTASREVGGAGTSCIGALSVSVIYGAVPGKGVVHAQAQLGGPGKTSAVMQLGTETDPTAIIAAITSPAFDANAQVRQYGIVDLQGRFAGFSGSQTQAFSADQQAQVDTFTYSVQGNILTSRAVLDQAAAAFDGCDLADRLIRSLEAGAQNGEGDTRCTVDGIPSDSAFLQVDREDETLVRLDVTNSAPQSPLVALRTQYDAWRAMHPCPVPPDDGGCSITHEPSWLALVVLIVARGSRRSLRRSRARAMPA